MVTLAIVATGLLVFTLLMKVAIPIVSGEFNCTACEEEDKLAPFPR
jgi:hypothetical protein